MVASGRQLGSGKVSQFYNPLVELFGLHFEEDVDLPGRVGTVTDHAAVRHLSSFVHVFGVPVRVARGEVLGLAEGQPVIVLTRCGKGRVVGAGLGSGLMGNTLCVGQSKDEEASLRNRQLLLALAANLLSGH